jgi:hypothetical protein
MVAPASRSASGGETAWLSLSQIADLFQRDKSVISRHIKNARVVAAWVTE